MVTIALSPTRVSAPWRVKLTTLLLWALAAGLIAFWALRLTAAGPASLAPVAAPEPVQIDAAAIAKALGAVQVAAPVSPTAPARYALQGVLAGRDSGGGAAVIAVGDQPAKPFKVGAKVEDGLLLQSLSAREAHLGPQMNGPATMTLRLPLPDKS